MRRLQFLLLLLGVGLFIYVVQKAGLGRIPLRLRLVGWSFAGSSPRARHRSAAQRSLAVVLSSGPSAVARFDAVLARTRVWP